MLKRTMPIRVICFFLWRVRGLVPGTSFIGVEVAPECSVVDTASDAS